jgi:hypothetical protein
MAGSKIAVADKGIRYVYLLGSRSRRAFGVYWSGLLLVLCFAGCAIQTRFVRTGFGDRNISVVVFRFCSTAAAIRLIATWLIAEDEVVASQIKGALLGLAPSV